MPNAKRQMSKVMDSESGKRIFLLSQGNRYLSKKYPEIPLTYLK
jgi:hypothetical protein